MLLLLLCELELSTSFSLDSRALQLRLLALLSQFLQQRHFLEKAR